MENPLLEAIEICGSQSALGERIGKGQYLISAWVRRYGCKVAPAFVIDVARATDWKVTPHRLRPDLYPHPMDGLPAHLRLHEADQNLLPAHGPECCASMTTLST